ncbi:uncharacterized protein LOC131954542 [Physella acuta]|uniref:uncharacterized protein LOC131954542 n=1 Tax=Physella acuta TaxID=109671 RepID=UPI0027DB64A3|nr:uncharacterized protein LOC131954542 [Physella acuta]
MGYYFYAINTKNNTQMIYHYPGRPPFNVYGGKLPTGYKPPNEPKDRMTTASTSARSAPQNAWTLGQGSALIDQHELLCPVYYYGEQCSEVCTCAGNKCRTDGSCYTTECHRGSLGDGCTRTDLVMTGGIFSHKVLIDSDSSTGVGLAGNTLTLVLNDPGLSRSFTLELAEDGENLRGGAAVGDAGSAARGNESSGPSAVYTLGVAPDNDPQLAAQLRDGNRFNTCIKADDQAEAGIEFQDEYTLYNMLISTTGTPLVVVVTCTNSLDEVLAKQKVRYKKGSRFMHLNINKKVKRCKIQSDNGPLELCEIDVFGDSHMMVNAEDIELSTSDDDSTAASTFALVSSLVLLFLCLLLNVVALLKTHTKSTQDLALTSE